MKNIVGVDVGTTHIKSGLFSLDGTLKYLVKDFTETSEDENGTYYEPQYMEHVIIRQISNLVKKKEKIDGIAVTGMAEAGLVLNTKTGQVSQIIPWFDQRTNELSFNINKSEESILYKKTGLRNSFKYGVYKYLWLLNSLGWKIEDTKWLSICDYVVYILTGNIVTDPSFAARTYLYNLTDRNWDIDILKRFGIQTDNLPVVIDSGRIAGKLKGTDIPVALCGHDHICATYGMQLSNSGLCNSCGTAETFVGLKDNFIGNTEEFDNGIVYGPYVDGKHFFVLTNISSSGQSIEWFRKQLMVQENSYQKMDEILKQVAPNPTDILYFPFLSGIGTPYFDSEARAAFWGLNVSHQWQDLLVAVIDGIGYQEKWVTELGYGKSIDYMICVGGATNSAGWMQRKTNSLGIPIYIPEIEEGTLYGAVKLMSDCNEFSASMEENKIKQVYFPDSRITEQFNKIYNKRYKPMAKLLCGKME